ncbi:unnamed protein product [Moneuplotes crassus]|uniref:Uncharacterized protein n=1 Tax=Euplotes crassus TaxID=5936 RepID=A0AAD2D8S8_EUPCR|nr:unnamed protein product [Moneuplotes crassus]
MEEKKSSIASIVKPKSMTKGAQNPYKKVFSKKQMVGAKQGAKPKMAKLSQVKKRNRNLKNLSKNIGKIDNFTMNGPKCEGKLRMIKSSRSAVLLPKVSITKGGANKDSHKKPTQNRTPAKTKKDSSNLSINFEDFGIKKSKTCEMQKTIDQILKSESPRLKKKKIENLTGKKNKDIESSTESVKGAKLIHISLFESKRKEVELDLIKSISHKSAQKSNRLAKRQAVFAGNGLKPLDLHKIDPMYVKHPQLKRDQKAPNLRALTPVNHTQRNNKLISRKRKMTHQNKDYQSSSPVARDRKKIRRISKLEMYNQKVPRMSFPKNSTLYKNPGYSFDQNRLKSKQAKKGGDGCASSSKTSDSLSSKSSSEIEFSPTESPKKLASYRIKEMSELNTENKRGNNTPIFYQEEFKSPEKSSRNTNNDSPECMRSRTLELQKMDSSNSRLESSANMSTSHLDPLLREVEDLKKQLAIKEELNGFLISEFIEQTKINAELRKYINQLLYQK